MRPESLTLFFSNHRSGAYSSLKKKLDARNDQRWDKNFACGGMDNDRVGGKIKVRISQSPRSAD